MGYHLAYADLVLLELPYSRSCPCRREPRRVPVVYILQRELLDELAVLRLSVCAVGVE